MLTMLGSPRRCCDGMTRRETLKAGALTAMGGFGLSQFQQAQAAGAVHGGKAKNVIVLFLLGGAATQDMVDLKPDAPAEVRGEFKPIPTNVAGLDFCEHLPLLAQKADRLAVVRSVNHQAGCHNCMPAYTGLDTVMPDQHPRDTDPPSIGSVCDSLAGAGGAGGENVPNYVFMPCWLGWGQSFRRSGPYGGFLGKQHDPLITSCMPYYDKGGFAPLPGNPQIVRGMPLLEGSSFPEGITIDRLSHRRSLLSQIDDGRRQTDAQLKATSFGRNQEQAFDLLTSSKLRTAFDLEKEDPKTVDRYGRTLFGNSTLIARRLIEQGVRFVNVTWDLFWGPVNVDYDAWDTHTYNFKILRENKLPGFDQTFTALLEDLEQRGMLDETLIVVMSEMGRTPRINGNAGGRDHWTFCYSNILAGGGIKGGTVYGASDAQAAYPKDHPVRPADIVATMYHCLGIDPEYRVLDRTNRPLEVAHGGRAIHEILV